MPHPTDLVLGDEPGPDRIRLHFAGGPLHRRRGSLPKAYWPVEDIYLGRAEDGDTWEVQTPPPAYQSDDPRPHYEPSVLPGERGRAVMVWQDQRAFDPRSLVPTYDRDDRTRITIAERAEVIYHEMVPPFGDTVSGRISLVAMSVGPDIAAVVVQRLAAALPEITDAQRQFLAETAAVLSIDAADADADHAAHPDN